MNVPSVPGFPRIPQELGNVPSVPGFPPRFSHRAMDHKVGIGGGALGAGIAIGCAWAEPCGAGVVTTGIVIATGSAIYDMATH